MQAGPHRVRVRSCAIAGLAAALALASSGAGCAARTASSLDDLQLAARVKTTIVNDPLVGTEDVRVQAVAGIVYLTGRLSSDEHRERVVELARAVPGVRDVQISMDVHPELAVLERRLAVERPRDDTVPRRWLAVGATVRFTRSSDGAVANATDVAPFVRLARKHGWRPDVGLSWNSRALDEGVFGSPPLARVSLRPVMGGVAYQLPVGRASLSLSIVAGYSFNTLDPDETRTAPFRAIDVSDSFAWRPGATVWYDLSTRVGMQVSLNYLQARPRVTFAGSREVTTRSIDAGALMLSVGGGFWIF